MIKNISRLSIIVVIFFVTTIVKAQQTLNIGICKDANTTEFNEFSNLLKNEIIKLTGSKFDVKFTELSSNMDTVASNNNIQSLMSNPNVDYVITLGYISSKQISESTNFPKPIIAATILDRELQKLPINSNNSTGVNNFTYIESIIKLKQNLIEFSQMFDTKNIAVIIPSVIHDNYPQLKSFFNQNKKDYNISLLTVKDSISTVIDKIPDNTEAVIVFPMLNFSKKDIKSLFLGLNKKQIPSLAISGINYLNLGATVTMTPEFTFQQLARQISLRILKISEGTNPSQIPVDISYKQVSIINMESLREINKFPDWNILNESILMNVTNFSSAKSINLQRAIAEALENNLQGKMAIRDMEIADREVRIAQANILPQISIGGSAVGLSENLVEASMGQKGEFTLSGSASLKQVLFSESVFANIAIQKLMLENKKYFNQQTVLDVVSNASVGYVSLLFTKSNLIIQNENVSTTMKNLKMAKAKEGAGQTTVSDVNRWVSELNMNKMKFNDSYTAYRSNMYQINQILNDEINSTINIGDSDNVDKTIFINEETMKNIFENPIMTERYASFIIQEMKTNSPEIHQLETMANIIDRKANMYKKHWFMPELVAFGGADQAFIRNGTIKPVGMPVPPPPDDMTFNYGLSLKIPIFQGGKTAAEATKSYYELDKINLQKEEVMDKLEVGIRSSVQKLRASFLELELSKNAAEAAEANFKMVQNAYFQGAVDLIKLIDAQEVMMQTKQMANISYYQYILDYIFVERYQAKFMFLSSEQEKEDYINRLNKFLLKK